MKKTNAQLIAEGHKIAREMALKLAAENDIFCLIRAALIRCEQRATVDPWAFKDMIPKLRAMLPEGE